jgi:hypothetical protein
LLSTITKYVVLSAAFSKRHMPYWITQIPFYRCNKAAFKPSNPFTLDYPLLFPGPNAGLDRRRSSVELNIYHMTRDGYPSYCSLKMETETVPKTDFRSKLMSLIISSTINVSKGVNGLYCKV